MTTRVEHLRENAFGLPLTNPALKILTIKCVNQRKKMRLQKSVFLSTILLFFTVFDAQILKAEEASESEANASVETSSQNDTISLALVAPELYYQLRRYPKFYGDDNTIHGSFGERSIAPMLANHF